MELIGKSLNRFRSATNHQRSIGKTISSPKRPTEAEVEEELQENEERGYGPNPRCAMCYGVGYVYADVPVSDPIFGKAMLCPGEGCLADSLKSYKRGEKYMESKGILTKGQSFKNFKRLKGTEEAFDSFKELAKGEAPYVMLLSYGITGNGKTHLCNALAGQLIERGIDTRLYTVGEMVSELKESIPSHTTEELIKKLQEIPALILDDFKVEYQSKWEMGNIENIIAGRYRAVQAGDHLITVLTTNRELDDLPERVVSRFFDPDVSKVVLNSGKDYRRR